MISVCQIVMMFPVFTLFLQDKPSVCLCELNIVEWLQTDNKSSTGLCFCLFTPEEEIQDPWRRKRRRKAGGDTNIERMRPKTNKQPQ